MSEEQKQAFLSILRKAIANALETASHLQSVADQIEASQTPDYFAGIPLEHSKENQRY